MKLMIEVLARADVEMTYYHSARKQARSMPDFADRATQKSHNAGPGPARDTGPHTGSIHCTKTWSRFKALHKARTHGRLGSVPRLTDGAVVQVFCFVVDD